MSRSRRPSPWIPPSSALSVTTRSVRGELPSAVVDAGPAPEALAVRGREPRDERVLAAAGAGALLRLRLGPHGPPRHPGEAGLLVHLAERPPGGALGRPARGRLVGLGLGLRRRRLAEPLDDLALVRGLAAVVIVAVDREDDRLAAEVWVEQVEGFLTRE